MTQRAAGVLFALLPALIATASRRRSPSAATQKARATADLGMGFFSLIKRLKGGLLAQAACYGWDAPPKVRFAPDAPLEGDGFEPSVPDGPRGDHSLIFLGNWGMSNKKTFSKNPKGGYRHHDY